MNSFIIFLHKKTNLHLHFAFHFASAFSHLLFVKAPVTFAKLLEGRPESRRHLHAGHKTRTLCVCVCMCKNNA